jgi:type II secretory pathway component PulF
MNKKIEKWRRGISKSPVLLKRSIKKIKKQTNSWSWQKGVQAAEGAVRHIRAPRLSLKEQALFAKRLSFLINAGVPIVEALHILRVQMVGGGQLVLDQIVKDVSGGQSLSRSFAKFPNVFSEFAVHIIRIGESSGTLFQNLNYLADELKKRQALRRKIVGAFIYPALITVATIGITVFLMVYLFPKITPIFTSLHAALPLSTRIVMAVSSLLIHWGILIFFVLVLVVGASVFAVKRNEFLQKFMERGYLRTPLVGTMVRSYNLANGSRTLGLLLKSGVQFSEALSVTADTTTNRLYRDAYNEMREVVIRGDKISTYLSRNKNLFPDIMTHMIAVGERSGTLADTLVYLSEMYDAEVDDFTRNLSTLIEPALMIIMGVVVGFIAISIITPIYGITQNLHA